MNSSPSYISLVSVSTSTATTTMNSNSPVECLDGASVSTYYSSLSDLDGEISSSLTTDEDDDEEEEESMVSDDNNEDDEENLNGDLEGPSKGQLFLNRQNSQRILRCGGKFRNGQPKIQPNLVGLLKHREIGTRHFSGSNTPLLKFNFQKRLFNMKIRNLKAKILKNKQKKEAENFSKLNLFMETFYTPIDKKSIYLGLSHDSSLLVQLIVGEVGDDGSQHVNYLNNSINEHYETNFFLIVHQVTPLYLCPFRIIPMAKRPVFSTFYVGFSPDGKNMAAHSFKNSEHCYFQQDIYNDCVNLGFLIMEKNFYLSAQAIFTLTSKKRNLSKGAYFRTLNNGILLDTGTEIVALLIANECPLEPTNLSRTTFRVNKIKNSGELRTTQNSGIHAIHLRNLQVQKCLYIAATGTQNWSSDELINNNNQNFSDEEFQLEQIKEYNTEISANSNFSLTDIDNLEEKSNETDSKRELPSSSSSSNTVLYLTETFLTADKVIGIVCQTLSKTKFRNYKFMGIQASEAYVLDVNEQIVHLAVLGIIELQGERYIFSRMYIELDWDLSRPTKISVLDLTMNEVNWMCAYRGNWHPPSLPIHWTPTDRLLTNNVDISLKYLNGIQPGIVFTR